MDHKTLKKLTIALSLATLAMIAAACSSGDNGTVDNGDAFVVNVTLSEFSIETDVSDIPVGVPVRFNIINDGALEHEFVVEAVGSVDDPLQSADGAPAQVENITSGSTDSLTFTFEEGGSFLIACHVPGHFEAGMKNTIDVGG